MALRIVSKTRKLLPVLCLLFLFSCTSHKQRWEIEKIHAVHPCSTYAKARLKACNPFDEIEAELYSNGSSTTLFFNALTFPFPSSADCSESVDLVLQIDDEAYCFSADKLAGGQKIKLSEEAQLLVVESLLHRRLVTVIIGRYHTILIPENFEKVYRQLFNGVHSNMINPENC